MENCSYTETDIELTMPKPYSKIQSIKYQEILPYITAVNQTKLSHTTLEKDINYVPKAISAIMYNNPDKKMLTNSNNNTLHNGATLPLIITNNPDI